MKNLLLSTGTFLLVFLFSTTSNAGIPLYQITGKWVSENVKATPIATINISQEGYQFYAQISELCRALNCNWGKLKATVKYNKKRKARLVIKHKKGNETYYVTIVPVSKSHIKVITKTVFKEKYRKPIRKKAFFKRTAMSWPKDPRSNQHNL